MRTRLRAILRTLWLLLTEVPGWADAPCHARLSRAAPIVLPAAAVAALLSWNVLWLQPRIHATRSALAPLTDLTRANTTLQLRHSEPQTAALAERADLAARTLLAGPPDLAPFLRSLQKEAAARGWEATFHPGDLSAEAAGPGAKIATLPVRGKLTPADGNLEIFPSLLALLERFATTGKRIDLMRLTIRADENRWKSVEINLRLACPVAHEKAPQ